MPGVPLKKPVQEFCNNHAFNKNVRIFESELQTNTLQLTTMLFVKQLLQGFKVHYRKVQRQIRQDLAIHTVGCSRVQYSTGNSSNVEDF